ncbi:MAG: patatin-like phospholipase family protein [Anaerolineae bacterium]|jgi:predicted acylesterase/phospholipase RssA|nr:patatin-like phospholipase family protein [Anaerolineae bacterium]
MSRNGRHQEDKIALVLAGGGMTGAVYEIGALRAIDDLLVDRSVNDFDIYVGTSAGSIVASFIANGVSPADMYRAIAGEHPELPALRREHIFSFNYREFIRRGVALPAKLAAATADYFLSGNSTLVDTLWSLTDVLPSGLYDGRALERYIRESLVAANGSNDFDALARELYIVATDLASGRRAVFGPEDEHDAAISQAVAASSALPIVYKPVIIGGREFVDGGLGGTASLDIAIERGATLVVCVNPLVPYDDDLRAPQPEADRLTFTRRGLSAIASQVSRITVHAGLKYHVKQLRRQHPEVDIILIEPRADDQMLAFGNIMRYGERLAIARHGFEAVTLDLAQDYQNYKEILARHGIPLTRRLVIEELQQIVLSGNDPVVIERILEARKPRCDEKNRDSVFCRLAEALAQLEREIEQRQPVAA